MKRVYNRPLLHIPTHMHNGKTLFSLKADKGRPCRTTEAVKPQFYHFYLIKIYLLKTAEYRWKRNCITCPLTDMFSYSFSSSIFMTANTSAETCCSAEAHTDSSKVFLIKLSKSSRNRLNPVMTTLLCIYSNGRKA